MASIRTLHDKQSGVQVGNSIRNDRFYLLDLIRLIAMIFMMQGHSLDALVSPQSLNIAEFPWNIWHFLRGLTAPIFLMISGAVQIFANKRESDGKISGERFIKQIRWAITLIGIGYLLMFPANRLRDLPFVTPEGWRYFFQVNILQLSGLTLIVIMIIMYFTRSTKTFSRISVFLGLVIMALSPFVDTINWFAFLPEWIAAYLSYKHGSLFFIFPFASYMFLGVGLGFMLDNIPAGERLQVFGRKTALYGGLVLLAGVIGTYSPISWYPTHDYYMSSPNFVLIRVGCTLLLMSGATLLYRATRSFEEYYSRLGKKSLYIYTSHLILLFGTPWFGGITRTYYRSLDLQTGVIIALAVLICTLSSAYWIDYYQRHSHHVRRGLRYSLTAMVLYALLV